MYNDNNNSNNTTNSNNNNTNNSKNTNNNTKPPLDSDGFQTVLSRSARRAASRGRGTSRQSRRGGHWFTNSMFCLLHFVLSLCCFCVRRRACLRCASTLLSRFSFDFIKIFDRYSERRVFVSLHL
jgi:hypothetical protein